MTNMIKNNKDKIKLKAKAVDKSKMKVKEKKKKRKEKNQVKNEKFDELFDKSNNFLNFDNVLLDVRLRKSLLYLFKFKHPTKIQKLSIPYILKGNDVIINSKTGSGKTMAYLIPSIQNLIKLNLNEKEHLKFFYKCIIISPTEELCLQIYEVAQKLCVYLKDIISINHNINRKFYEHPTILVSTPKNLCNYIIEKKKKNNLDILMNLKVLIIDEADVLHTEEFQKYMNKLTNYLPKSFSKKYQIIMASATLKKSIIEKTNLFLHKPIYLNIEEEIDNIIEKKEKKQKFKGKSFYYIYEDELTKYIYLFNLIKDKMIQYKSIIFTNTIRDAYKIKIFLTYFNISSSILNPNHPILIRQNIIVAFNNSKFYFLICPQYEKNTFENIKNKNNLVEQIKLNEQIFTEDNDNTDETYSIDENNEDNENYSKDENIMDNEYNSDGGIIEYKVDCDTENNSNDEIYSDDENEINSKNNSHNEEKDFLYSRGLDFYDVKCVVNFDMPLDEETFLHRIGRTCRLNNKGISISFINKDSVLEKDILNRIADKNICFMIKKDMEFSNVEKFRYRVESTLNKCTNKKIKLYIQKEILYQSLKSKQLKEFFNSHINEKKKISKIVRQFNKTIIPQKLIKDRNESIFLNKSKTNNKLIKKGDKEQNKLYSLKKNSGFIITEKGYEEQLSKEPKTEVADPSKLPPLCGRKLKKYIYVKYIKKNKKKNIYKNKKIKKNKFRKK
ncbi:DEAD/DEAH box ATP-dependent RNA helicase, putative [Plasmodium gallinaceum]|uniref:DEAD/DEAH box ATP-dependent RNA helicase, putative n=1 Tax=Plasmodium gallinaceum TaxID=5849 RepID=A0A1J1H180_PLAGA|nr:DEAD/DEAH box ATP-dependent RNA helicase, putative [Plasmodium gallinaceum]CRG97045.1 DEAD/DEAH box ATP-dependent RNA helicase, putative [Plasmodium gallinaceum]